MALATAGVVLAALAVPLAAVAGPPAPSVPTATGPFPDVPATHPFAEPIGWAADNGVATGRADGTFGPATPVSRQAFVAFLARYWVGPAIPDTCPAAPFPDVAVNDPFCPAIWWASRSGIVTGHHGGTFDPAEPITRHSMAAVLYRFRGSPLGVRPACDATAFTDTAGTPFCGQIGWLADAGIAQGFGDGTFHPGAPVTRGAAVAFLAAIDPGCAPATEPTGGCPRPAVEGDYDGDRAADPVWYTSRRVEAVPAATTGALDELSWYRGGAAEPFRTVVDPDGSQVVDADYDGDGRWETARLLDGGTWATDGGTGTITFPEPAGCGVALAVGEAGGIAVIGDWDGDRADEPGWWCPADATWHRPGREPLTFGTPVDLSNGSAHLDAQLFSVPAPADWDGDGTTELGVFEPVDGTIRWATDGDTVEIVTGYGYGVPTPADMDGDGAADPLLFSPADGHWEPEDFDPLWHLAGLTEVEVLPAPGDFDGDGDDDLGELVLEDLRTSGAYHVAGRPPTALAPGALSGGVGFPTALRPSSLRAVIRMTFVARSCVEGFGTSTDPSCPRVVPPWVPASP